MEQLGIKSPMGKEKWVNKCTIDVILSNEKYIGIIRIFNSRNSEVHYLVEDNNPAIISDEKFKAVQIEKTCRSNVTTAENGTKRKDR
ncbi:recombinase family protein [Clostridium ljungdahlii]|uniref:recombinase family protein n=1 Tax=Clostridium ljungdahlii TaxID=1538 RepID=UPI00386C269B